MSPCPRPEIAELLGSYVVGACTGDEAGAVRTHIATCASCSDDLAALAPAREGLLADVSTAVPPEHLKSRIMGQVRADAALFDAARAPEAPARRGRAWHAWLRSPRPAWALALVAVVAVAAAFAVAGGPDRETVYAARVDGVAAPGGRASLAVHDHEATLRVAGLPAAGAGRMYEVWMSDASGRPRPAGVRFAIDRRGSGEVRMPAPPPAGREIMVTSEVGGDAPSPTRAPILRVGT